MYKNSIVVLIDLLGFSKFVENESYEIVSDQINAFYDEGRKLKGELQGHREYEDINESDALKNDFHFRFISDSIIISMAIEKDDENKETLCVGLLNSIKRLSDKMIELGIIIRGGISYGELYDDGELIFGKALVEANKLEKNVACFPRIILSGGFIDFIGFKNLQFYSNPGYPIELDSEGVYQVTIFSHLIFKAKMYVYSKLERDIGYIKEYLEGYKKKIDIGMKNSDTDISDKYKKLKVQYDASRIAVEEVIGKPLWRQS